MLSRLVKRHLQRYPQLTVAILVLQIISVAASLYLPSLNADIIDKGVTRGDTGYIWSTGGWMLAVSLVQVVAAITAAYVAARLAMFYGRDARGDLFARVGEFSSREINSFGAPTLITRTTNDVQQVQMLVLSSCTMIVAAPIIASICTCCTSFVLRVMREPGPNFDTSRSENPLTFS